MLLPLAGSVFPILAPYQALWPSFFHVTLGLSLSGLTPTPFHLPPRKRKVTSPTFQGPCRLATQAALVTESPLLVASFVVRKLLFLLWN